MLIFLEIVLCRFTRRVSLILIETPRGGHSHFRGVKREALGSEEATGKFDEWADITD